MKSVRRTFLCTLCCIFILTGSIRAYASDTYHEITSPVNVFGLGDYVVYDNIEDMRFHFFTANDGVLSEFVTTDSIKNGQPLSLSGLSNGEYFAAILNGKYAIFTRSFKQITPNKYTWITFCGNTAIGEIADPQMSPNDNSKTKYELIDLVSGDILVKTVGSLIRTTADGRYYVTDKGIYDTDGKKLFEPKAAKIASEDIKEFSDFIWIGEDNQRYAVFHSNEQKSEWYDDILPRTMLDTKLLTASRDGMSFLLGLDGNVITKTSGTITLLSTDVAAISESNTTTYWNHNGQIDFLDNYSTVQSLYADSPSRLTNLIVRSYTTGKWGIVREDGSEQIPPHYDLAENITQSNNIFLIEQNGETQIWNLSTGKKFNIPYQDGIELSTYIGGKEGKWIAAQKKLDNGVTVANLYDLNGNLAYENVHQIFYLGGNEVYARAINTKKDSYCEVLESADGNCLFSAPSNESISQVSSAIIRTVPCHESDVATARCFLNLSFKSDEPRFSYIRYYWLRNEVRVALLFGSILFLIVVISIRVYRKKCHTKTHL